MRTEHVGIGSADVACLFADHDGKGIGLLADAFCGTVAKAELLGYVEVMADGQDARGSCYPALHDYHGSVVQRAVLEEYVLDEPLCYLGIDLLARTDELGEGQVVLQDNEGTHALLAHVHASHDDGEDGLALVAELTLLLVPVETEEAEEAMSLLTGTEVVEEAAYVFLEEDDDSQSSDAHQLVEDAAQKLHLQYLADDNPATDEEQYAIEDVHRARLLHQFVAIVEYDGYKENVNEVFETNVRHRGNLLFYDLRFTFQHVAYLDALPGFLYFVDAKDVCAFLQGNGIEDGSAVQSFVGRRV